MVLVVRAPSIMHERTCTQALSALWERRKARWAGCRHGTAGGPFRGFRRSHGSFVPHCYRRTGGRE